ncbi:DHA1 family multidrug resistance protein-like MFS transporter [Tahibacter aquaticus]|uniref:DHA1 family multidrug resistance protein-like MFS transporter n=1 Tax=Tahibacter aquaticus TaxID=520092 RepID=A0A4R6Z070_9GAMM|nr:MFS transporter [Tahibacter aquaticus]TDR44888.1 DHA1 family multidrug resistance protein-like MFS transporter [Tahibacter aquaticus]
MSSAALSDSTRRRGLAGLLLYTFFMVTGFALLMPLVATHFVNQLHLAAAAVGGALALRQLLQQGLAVFGGVLADRFGIRPMIAAGVLLRALGFASLGFATDIPWLLLAMTLSALGGALFEAPYQAAIASLATEQQRPRYYALSNWISGVAGTLGPLIGVALLRFDFFWVCSIAAACFALNFAVVLLLLPRLDAPASPPPLRRSLSRVGRDRRFLAFVALMGGYWFVAVQINISFPLLLERLTASVDSIGVMFALSAALTVSLQYWLVDRLNRRLSPGTMLAAGVALLSAGAGVTALASTFGIFLGGIALFAIGAVLSRPSQQLLIAEMADPRALGSYLGVSSLSLAVGGSIGNVAGGWLADPSGPGATPWLAGLVFATVGAATSLGLYRFGRRQAALRSKDTAAAGVVS